MQGEMIMTIVETPLAWSPRGEAANSVAKMSCPKAVEQARKAYSRSPNAFASLTFRQSEDSLDLEKTGAPGSPRQS